MTKLCILYYRLFQHHKLYVYIITHDQTQEVTVKDITVECPSMISEEFAFIGPLDEALPMPIYDLTRPIPPKTPSQIEVRTQTFMVITITTI